MNRKAVVVGASLAGLRAAESLRRHGHEGPLTIVGAEAHRPYDRPPLSKQVLTGKVAPEDTALHVDEGLDAEWVLGVRATAVDFATRRIRLGRDDLPFDMLVIATGAEPRRLPGAPPGPGVHYLRTVDDSKALREAFLSASRLAVIGAGFIGLEVASSARQNGLEVTVVEALPVPLAPAIGRTMGAVVADLQRRHGVRLVLNAAFERLEGSDRVQAIGLLDGSTVECDLVVVGIGVIPTTAWLEGSGVDVSNGVLCDSRLRVLAGGRARRDVVAAGDVARWSHPAYESPVRIEHWTNASEQGEAAGRTLLFGDDAPAYDPTPYVWSDQHGLKLQFVGCTREGDEVEVVEGDPGEDRFVAAYGRGGRLVAGFGVRRPARVMALQRMIGEGAPFPPSLTP